MTGFAPTSDTKQMTKWHLNGTEVFDVLPESMRMLHPQVDRYSVCEISSTPLYSPTSASCHLASQCQTSLSASSLTASVQRWPLGPSRTSLTACAALAQREALRAVGNPHRQRAARVLGGGAHAVLAQRRSSPGERDPRRPTSSSPAALGALKRRAALREAVEDISEAPVSETSPSSALPSSALALLEELLLWSRRSLGAPSPSCCRPPSPGWGGGRSPGGGAHQRPVRRPPRGPPPSPGPTAGTSSRRGCAVWT